MRQRAKARPPSTATASTTGLPRARPGVVEDPCERRIPDAYQSPARASGLWRSVPRR